MSLQTFTLLSKRLNDQLNDGLTERVWSEIKDSWHATPAGQELCQHLGDAWVNTVQWWTNPNNDWSRNSIMAYTTWTLDFLNVLGNDYVYRTNNAVPNEPLWNFLEQTYDMPAMWSQLVDAIANRYEASPGTFNDDLDALNRQLSLIALARCHRAYPLKDSIGNQTVWADVPPLAFFWSRLDNPDEAKHQSLMHGISQLPSSMPAFYTYAAAHPIPSKTTVFLLNTQHTDIEAPIADGALLPWCSWLATLRHDPNHWAIVQTKWPELANVITIAQSMASAEEIGAQALLFYRNRPLHQVAVAEDMGHLF